MTEVILFHHVLGLTDGVQDFAEHLTEKGHVVHTPDLFEGQTFPNIDAGFAYIKERGFESILERAESACVDLPHDVVYAGFSLGVMAAQHMLQTTPGGLGGLFLHAFLDPEEIGGLWPDVPVHVYAMDADPFFVDDGDLEVARAWQAGHANLRLHLYPGTSHLFTDSSIPSYDAPATRRVLDHINGLLTTFEGTRI